MRSRGAPWRPARSPPPRPGRFEPSPSRWRAATPPLPPVPWLRPQVAAPRRCPSPSVRPSVRPPRSAPPRLLLPGAAPRCVSLPGRAAARIRRPFRRRPSADVAACWTRRGGGSARGPPASPHQPSPPRPAPCSGGLRPSAGRVPRSARRGPVAVSSPPGVPRPSGAGWTDGRRGRVGRPRCGPAGGCGPRPVSRGRRRGGAGLATGAGGGVEEESGPPPSSPRFLHAVAAAAARRDPRGTRVRCAMGAPSPRVGGRGGRSSVRPAGRSGFPAPPRPRFLASRVLRLARGVPGHPRHPARSRPARLLVLAPLPG